MQLWQRIAETRDALWQAGVRTREAQEHFEDYEIALKAGVDYKALGSSNNIRDQMLDQLLRKDVQWDELRMALRGTEDRRDQLEMQLYGLYDERRHQRSILWAEMTEVLRGLVDCKGYAPRQVAEELMNQGAEQAIDDLPF